MRWCSMVDTIVTAARITETRQGRTSDRAGQPVQTQTRREHTGAGVVVDEHGEPGRRGAKVLCVQERQTTIMIMRKSRSKGQGYSRNAPIP